MLGHEIDMWMANRQAGPEIDGRSSENHPQTAQEVKTMGVDIPLLEALAEKVGCDYLSDLRHLGEGQRKRLAFEIEKIPPQAPSLSQWNDALEYLAKEPPQDSPETAKARLLDRLSQPQNRTVLESSFFEKTGKGQ